MNTSNKIICGLLVIIVILLGYIALQGIQVNVTAVHHHVVKELSPFEQKMEQYKEEARAMFRGNG